MKVVVIGSGNVAQALSKVISESSMELVQVFARNIAKAEEIAHRCRCSFTDQRKELAQADLYILAITEDSLASLSAELDFGDAVVVHTSGAVSVDKLYAGIVDRGVIYPLQTFTKWRDVDFRSIPILIEGTTIRAETCIRQFAYAISDCVKEYTFDQRLYVNLAAVFANNFTNHMYTISEHILNKAGLPFDMIKPLILETAHKAVDHGAPRKIQTDLVARNSFGTRLIHSDMLRNDINYQTIYISLSNNILEMLKKT